MYVFIVIVVSLDIFARKIASTEEYHFIRKHYLDIGINMEELG